jgi:hypothetical protein
MTRIRTLFLLLTIIGPMHMAEQMLTQIDEFHMIRALVASHYYTLFAPASADVASVLLITIVWTTVSLLFYALLHDGTPRLAVTGLFGAFGASEIHHLVEALAKGAYDPGVVTCIPYAVAGGLMVAAVVRELKLRRLVALTEQSFA